MATRSKVFVSYSHHDTDWLTRLQVHLAPLVRSGVIDLWDDTRIGSGDIWRKEIQTALDETRVAILLVSADFMSSDFIVGEELPQLLMAAEHEGITILPVILSASHFEETPKLKDFQAVNPPSRPVIGMAKVDQEALFQLVARTVFGLVNPHKANVAATGTMPLDRGPADSEPRPIAAADTGADRSVVSELQERVKATQQLTATFAPERYMYMSLFSIFGVVCLISVGKLFFGGSGSNAHQMALMAIFLGAGGAALFSCGQLFKVRTRTFEFIRELTETTGESV